MSERAKLCGDPPEDVLLRIEGSVVMCPMLSLHYSCDDYSRRVDGVGGGGGGGGVGDGLHLTSWSDPHVLLTVQHEASHWLSLRTVRRSLAH